MVALCHLLLSGTVLCTVDDGTVPFGDSNGTVLLHCSGYNVWLSSSD